MALFGKDDHADNPPHTWVVQRNTVTRAWNLCGKDGGVIDVYRTKREAEAAKLSGRWVDLYDKETRWFAGENVPGWKPSPYAQC